MLLKHQKSDFIPDCIHAREFHELTEHTVEGVKVMSFQCKMCDTFGQRPCGFILDELRVPDFDTLETDTEIELYYKLNWLSQFFPDKKIQRLIAQTKHQLKTRFNALKYDDPAEGTRRHWFKCEKAKIKLLKEMPDEEGEADEKMRRDK